MSEYGLIKAETLTALADGLRAKEILPETRSGVFTLDYQLYKTDNTISSLNPIPAAPHSDTLTLSFNISIPEASKLKFITRIGIVSNGPVVAGAGRAGQVFIWDSASNLVEGSKVDIITSLPAGETEIQEYINVVEGNVATLRVNRTSVGSNTPLFGVITEVYPLNANGEVIKGLFEREATIFNTVTPSTMVEAINDYEPPLAPPEEAYHLDGAFNYRFYNDKWSWFINLYKDKITTANIATLDNAFYGSTVTSIPFVLNVSNITSFYSAFSYMRNLKECPIIRGTLRNDGNYEISLEGMFNGCELIRSFEETFEEGFLAKIQQYKITSSYSCPRAPSFSGCYSLRQVPSWFKEFSINNESTAFPSSYYAIYSSAFNGCSSLDEVRDVPVWTCQAAQTSNMFISTFNGLLRAKAVVFSKNEDGSPIEAKWQGQTIDCTQVGYTAESGSSTIYAKNSGITRDKAVSGDATYQALKNDPDWYAINIAYSRFNHDSAVETINSLPDTSAYLATSGGTNTIKFKGDAGSKTDGGAINTLTEAEIAVATAKGWTVTLA
jgi:hypothetical protein